MTINASEKHNKKHNQFIFINSTKIILFDFYKAINL